MSRGSGRRRGGASKFDEGKHRRNRGRFANKPGAGDDAPRVEGLKHSGVGRGDIILDLRGTEPRMLGTVGEFIQRHLGDRISALRTLSRAYRDRRIGFRSDSGGGVEGSGDRAIPPLAETPEWTAAKSLEQKEAAAVAWVLLGQRETGFEHAAILTLDGGLLHAGTTGRRDRVRIPITPGRDVISHHSHPDEASLSGPDFAIAWAHSPKSEARAYTLDGGRYVGQALRPPGEWLRQRRAAFLLVESELSVLQRNDGVDTYKDVAAHLVNTEVEKIGWIRYQADLPQSTQAVLKRLTPDRSRFRAGILRELLDGQ